MPIIDAQVHIWRKGTASPPHLATPYLAEDAIRDMDAAGVDGAILHPPASWDPDSNEQAVEAVLAHPKRFAILGYPPVEKPETRPLIATWKQRPGMLGLRLYFNKPHNRSWPMDGTLDWLWPEAEKAQLPVALLAGDWLPLLGQIATRHPGLKLMVDHMGALRGARGSAAFPNMKDLTALSKLPNVAVKLTGGPFYAFGPRRLFWGTDITKMPCSWRQCLTHFQEIDWIPDADKKLILGDAICDWIGWKR
jgi:predicted TIM-barrel fold metal-dependent hydrolase